jgi:hypothetical protein
VENTAEPTTRRVMLYMTDSEYRRLREHAAREKRNVSAEARVLIDQAIASALATTAGVQGEA